MHVNRNDAIYKERMFFTSRDTEDDDNLGVVVDVILMVR